MHIVQACFDAYLPQDRGTAAALLADDYVFTSPQDDHIDRTRSLSGRSDPPSLRHGWSP